MPNAITAIFGADTTPMQAETEKMLAVNGAAAKKFEEQWIKTYAEKDLAESAANDRSLAKLKLNDDAKLLETERFLAAQRAMYEEQAAIAAIGNGSIPENMATGAGAAGVAGAERVAAREVHSMSTVTRELTVLMREGLRGNFTRMIGSATILIGAMGGLASRLMAMLPGIAIGAAAVLAVPYLKMRKAESAADESEQDVQDTGSRLGMSLVPKINDLRKRGIITGDKARDWIKRLRKGDYDDVQSIISEIQDAPNAKKQHDDQLNEEIFEKYHEYAREQMTTAQKVADDKAQIVKLNKQIADGEKQGLDTAQLRLQSADAYVQMQRDENDLTKENAAAQKKADEAKKKGNKKDQPISTREERGGSFGLNNQQQIGAYAAVPPDWAILINSTKETAVNTRGLRERAGVREKTAHFDAKNKVSYLA